MGAGNHSGVDRETREQLSYNADFDDGKDIFVLLIKYLSAGANTFVHKSTVQ